MKILFICNYGLLYGANRSLLSVVEHCHNSGDDVIVLVPANGSMAEELEKKGIPYVVKRCFPTVLYVKPIMKHLLLPFCFLYDLLILPSLVSFARKQRPDLIYSNTTAENLGVIIAKIIGVKHVSHIREFMSLDHNAHFVLGNAVKRKYLSMSDGLIFVSRAVAEYVMQGRELLPTQQVIYNGITMNSAGIEKLNSLPEHLHFGLVGVLQSSKGHEMCIDYFSKYLLENSNATLHIFGEGYAFYEKRLKELVVEKGIQEKVVFHGFVKDAAAIYSKINVLLVFARSEGFGRVTIEGILRGLPVIGYNAGGTTELISHKQTGFLFNSYEEFQASLRYLLSGLDTFNQIRFEAFNHARLEFSEEKYTANVYSFLKALLNK